MSTPYAIDVAQACRERGIKTVAVTAKFINEEPREAFFEHIDAANIDLNAFTEQFYKKSAVGGSPRLPHERQAAHAGVDADGAREIAEESGVRHAYTGNVHDPEGNSTYCHDCGELLIGRDWNELSTWNLDADGCFSSCGTRCAGVFEPDSPSDWGRKRQPVRLAEFRAT